MIAEAILSKIPAFAGPLLKVLGAACMVLVIPLSISRCSLQNDLTEANSELERVSAQKKALEASIALQNQAIESLRLQTQAAEARFDRASAIAEAQNQKLDKTIAQLKSASGKSCNDAMPLVEEVIRMR